MPTAECRSRKESRSRYCAYFVFLIIAAIGEHNIKIRIFLFSIAALSYCAYFVFLIIPAKGERIIKIIFFFCFLLRLSHIVPISSFLLVPQEEMRGPQIAAPIGAIVKNKAQFESFYTFPPKPRRSTKKQQK